MFVGSDGRFTLENISDYASLSDQTKAKLVQPLMQKLSDPDELAGVARAISAIFPSLPKNLVAYSKTDFTMNLTLQELLSCAIAVGNELQSVNPVNNIEALSQIADLEEQVRALKVQISK